MAQAGKYALFIWAAYGISFCAFVGMIVASLVHARHWRRQSEAFAEAQTEDRLEPQS